MRALMLAPYMKMGYGVSEAIACLTRTMEKTGVQSTIGCLEHDAHFPDLDIRAVEPRSDAVLSLVSRTRATAVVAHGTPYFEVLPDLVGSVGTVAYEYGDPTPELFAGDADERRAIAARKRADVYPVVDRVAAISEFVRHDIAWPDAQVVRLGVEHVPDRGTKRIDPLRSPGPLRVGSLMRLGVGEARYKGNSLLLDVKALVDKEGLDVRFEVMGRGTRTEAAELRDAGITVHLNATDAERSEYLRGLDVFFSPSLWEGMNLPLVEAAASGTVALAFDTGAHPEFTPLVCSHPEQVAQLIGAYERDPGGLLADHSDLCYRHVRRGLSWETAAVDLGRLIREVDDRPPYRRPLRVRVRRALARTRAHADEHGRRATARAVAGYAGSRLGVPRGGQGGRV